MPVEASFPDPLVFEPVSGVHKHTIILLHGRGGSADTFGPALLNTPILTTSPQSNDSVRGGQAAEDGAYKTAITPNPSPAAEITVADSSASVPLPSGVIPDETPVAGAPCSPALAQEHIPPSQRGIPTTLAQALPHARFVFPNAPRQRATVYKRSVIRQWFDDWHLRPELSGDLVSSRYDEGLQTSGLGTTVRYLHELVAREADLVGGVRNVILGGISQGCAASLVTALLWEGEDRLGAVVGMCGWLPYSTQMREIMEAHDGGNAGEAGAEGDEFELFERPATRPASPAATGSVDAAVSWLRDELELPAMQKSGSFSGKCGKIPIGLYHGRDDRKVDCHQGQVAADFLLSLDMEARRCKLYDGVGHDYSEDMLADILGFLQSVLNGTSS